MKFKSDIELQAGLKDGSNDIGTAGQILSSTGSQTNWIDQSSIVASEAKLVVIECKNTSGVTISKGTPVYQTGTVGATDVIEIDAADASDEDKMAAIGLLQTDLVNNAFGKVVITGELLNITTSPIDGVTPVTGDTIYVKSGGGLTLTKPTGVNFIQNIGLVGKVSGGNSGSITVSSIMRSNDVPTPLYIDHTNQRLGIGTTTPGAKLDISSTGTGDSMIIRNDDASSSAAPVLMLLRDSASAADGDYLGQIKFKGNSDTGAERVYAKITTKISDATNGAEDSLIETAVKSGGSNLIVSRQTGTDLKLINGIGLQVDGNVGIGTTSPAQPFQVDAGSNIASFRSVGTGENNKELLIQTGGDRVILDAKNADDGTATSLAFELGNSEKARLTTTGLGIGTTSPGQKLQVEGNSWIKGIYYDTSGDAGTSGQVLSSTATGTNWVSGSGLPGGPYLPLSAGSGEILTGDLAMNNNIGIITKDSSGAFRDILKLNSSNVLEIGSSSLNTNIIFKNSGNVGIGTTSPGAKLHVRSTASNYVATFKHSTGTGYAPGSILLEAGQGNARGQGIYHYNNVADENWFTGVPYNVDSKKWIVANKYSTTQDVDTAQLNYALLTIDSDTGNVGIGTTSPSTKLQVDSSTAFSLTNGSGDTLLLTNDSTVSAIGAIGPSIGFGNMNNNNRTSAIAAVRTGGDHDNMGLAFFTHPSDSGDETVVQKMTITHEGNVGIGTTSPGQKLDVNGNANIDGTLFVNTTNNHIRLVDTDNTGNFSVGVNTNFQIRDITANTTPLTIRAGTPGNTILTTSSGRVGIGLSSPGVTLHVNGFARLNGGLQMNATNATIYQILDSDLRFGTNNTERMRIDNTGNVGIGVTIPTADLHIQGSSATDVPILRVGGFGNSGSKLELAETLTNGDMNYGYSFFNDGNSSNTLIIKAHNNSTTGITAMTIDRGNALTTFGPVPVVGTRAAGDNSTRAASTAFVTSAISTASGNYLPLSAGSSYPLTGDLYIEGADKALRINNGTQPVVFLGDGGANTDGQLILYNSSGGANIALNGDNQNHYITNGNFGMGTTSPGAKLDINQTQDGQGIIIRSSLVQPEISFVDDGTGDSFSIGHNRAGSRLDIEINGVDTHTFKQNGNVGIGTTNPGVNFQVGDGTTDTTSRFYHSDNTYTEVNGYGLYFSRLASYIRPVFDGTQDLYFGNINATWNSVQFDATTITFDNNNS